jgi:HAD superfamily hydrolase (TIGR01509 family)
MSLNAASYKNIIFDLGGVILNIDYSLLAKSFRLLGIENFEEHYSKAQQEGFFDLYEKGLMSTDEFTQRLGGHCKPGTTDQNIKDAWNSMLLDLPEERLKLLHKLKLSHRIFLLSNTNEIHMTWIYDYLLKQFGVTDLSDYFEKVYLSYEVGMRKPDAEIFELVLKENHLMSHETFFIDDSPQHLEGAKKVGIQTYWLDVKKENIVELFG